MALKSDAKFEERKRKIKRKANSWEIYTLCHVIDLKQSLEGNLKV